MNIDLDRSAPRHFAHSGRILFSVLASALFLAAVTFASVGHAQEAAQEAERAHQITWAHPAAADVRNFVVLISPEEGNASLARTVDLGKPTATRAGPQSIFTALVSFRADEYLAVAAIGYDGQMSVPSGWGAMPPTRPGQPTVRGQ